MAKFFQAFSAGKLLCTEALANELFVEERIHDGYGLGTIAELIEFYFEAKNNPQDGPARSTAESGLNRPGCHQLVAGRLEAAIDVLQLNADEHPNSANAFDSLGEAYPAYGDEAAAIENYARASTLDPTNSNAKEILERLRKR
jgi:tetratricopeptide (TPR) repeat protein